MKGKLKVPKAPLQGIWRPFAYLSKASHNTLEAFVPESDQKSTLLSGKVNWDQEMALCNISPIFNDFWVWNTWIWPVFQGVSDCNSQNNQNGQNRTKIFQNPPEHPQLLIYVQRGRQAWWPILGSPRESPGEQQRPLDPRNLALSSLARPYCPK